MLQFAAEHRECYCQSTDQWSVICFHDRFFHNADCSLSLRQFVGSSFGRSGHEFARPTLRQALLYFENSGATTALPWTQNDRTIYDIHSTSPPVRSLRKDDLVTDPLRLGGNSRALKIACHGCPAGVTAPG